MEAKQKRDIKKRINKIRDILWDTDYNEADDTDNKLIDVEEQLIEIEKYFKDDDIIEDGFGSAWSAWCPMCGRKSMSVVRPGKVQCNYCG